jgi:hypothetical protein
MTDTARTVVRRVVIVALLVLAAGMVWYSGTIKGEPEAPTLTDAAVVRFIPAADTPSALRQGEIGIGLEAGWDADLRINGVDIPDDEERVNGPQGEITFAPGEGKVIEQLAPGKVQVTATLWQPAKGQTHEQGSHTVSWSFQVA